MSISEPQVVARPPATSRLDCLTPREREVLAEIARGKNNAAIASALVLTQKGVEKHINALFQKLDLAQEPDVHRRVMAVLMYLSQSP